MSDGLRAIVNAAKGYAVMGTGVLVVNGYKVAILHGVSYDSQVKFYDHILGTAGGRVDSRYVTEADASLKADFADVLGRVELFTWNATSAPSDGRLPVYTATYAGVNGITITFGSCNIIPSGIKMVAGDWVSGSLEIRSVGRSLPTITDVAGSWVIAPPADLSDVPAGTTYSIALGQVVVSTRHRVTIKGRLTCAGILQV